MYERSPGHYNQFFKWTKYFQERDTGNIPTNTVCQERLSLNTHIHFVFIRTGLLAAGTRTELGFSTCTFPDWTIRARLDGSVSHSTSRLPNHLPPRFAAICICWVEMDLVGSLVNCFGWQRNRDRLGHPASDLCLPLHHSGNFFISVILVKYPVVKVASQDDEEKRDSKGGHSSWTKPAGWWPQMNPDLTQFCAHSTSSQNRK